MYYQKTILSIKIFARRISMPIFWKCPVRKFLWTRDALSLPGIHESVKRGNKIHAIPGRELGGHDEIIEGYLARVMQHEFDHLEGKMFIDHLSPLRKQMIKGKLNAMLKGKAHCTYKVKTVKK